MYVWGICFGRPTHACAPCAVRIVRNRTRRDYRVALSDQVRNVSELGVGYIVGVRL